MDKNTTQAPEKSDELDLFVLLASAYNFIKKFGTYILVCAVFGLLLGLLLYVFTPKQYPSTLIASSTLTSHQDQIQIIKHWEDLIERGETITLAQILEINPSITSKVESLTASDIITNINTERVSYQIKVMVTDTAVLAPLQKAILSALENNPYTKELLTVKRAAYTELIEKVKSEIQKLDSVKLQVADISSGQRNTSSYIFDVSNINFQLVELHEKRHKYEEELTFLNPVHVLQGFSKANRHQYPKLLPHLVIGFFAGGFIGYLLSLFLSLKNKLKNQEMQEIQVKQSK